MGVGLQGQRPCSSQAQTSFVHSSAASGAAQPPRPQGASFRRARAARSWGKAKKSAAHSMDTKKGCCDILYIAIIPFYCFKFQRKPRFIYHLPIPLERGERGGAAAAPAGRELPQEARAARSWREAKVGVNAMR